MIVRHARKVALIAAVGAALATGGCTKLKTRSGYLVDETLVTAIQPGVDNKDSVQTALGRPTFTGQFNQNDWYYVSRNSRNFAFNQPKVSEQTVLRVRFDEAGNVTAVDRRGVEQVASIEPSNDKTPTLGRDRSFLEELFGNIGSVGSGGVSAPTGGNTGPN
ncbi:MAG TPA: outer membrane protein assembly factor BamE [Allosphingosinicella sp.]|jgi:outer membrane protein assembly factor BamE (lipoprotein component of BamABCDE complex)